MNWKNPFAAWSTGAKWRLGIGVAVIAIATGIALWWLMTPSQQLLFGKLREADAAEIVQSLDEWKVPYTITDGGTAITVASDRVYETRMRLVSAGVPRGGHVGFELFDDSDFGLTEFAQRVNYQRALQGEIERTIGALPGVQTARVHLTIRRPGLFVGERETSKASVAITLQPGEELTRSQVSGIRSLVAAAVEGLSPAEVSVLDSDGALLASAGAGAGAIGMDERMEEETRLETQLQSRVAALLAQVLDDDAFRVSVDATLNFDTVREVSERPLADTMDGSAMLVRKRTNVSDAPGAAGRTQNQEESEFVHGTAREEVARAPGRVERLSIAVILPTSLDEAVVARVRALVAAAAGLQPERGDLLEVMRLPAVRAQTPDAAVAATPRVMPDAAATRTVMTAWWQWLVAGALGLLIGTIVAFAAQRRPRRLTQAEREAVLIKLRGWLAENKALT